MYAYAYAYAYAYVCVYVYVGVGVYVCMSQEWMFPSILFVWCPFVRVSPKIVATNKHTPA